MTDSRLEAVARRHFMYRSGLGLGLTIGFGFSLLGAQPPVFVIGIVACAVFALVGVIRDVCAAALSAEVAPAPSLLSSATEKEAWERALALTDGSDEQVAALDTLVRAVEVAVRAEVAPAPTDELAERERWFQRGFLQGREGLLREQALATRLASGVQPAAYDARLAEIEARYRRADATRDRSAVVSSMNDIPWLLSLVRSRTVAPPAAPGACCPHPESEHVTKDGIPICESCMREDMPPRWRHGYRPAAPEEAGQ